MKVTNNPQVYMEPGTYYVGDLCYVMNDRWDEFCKLTIRDHEVLDGGFALKDGTEFATFTTMYGDGVYSDKEGRSYPVDAGLIGCVNIDDIDGDILDICDDGHIIKFEKPFICEKVDGIIYFGKIAIDTGDSDSNDYEGDDDEY